LELLHSTFERTFASFMLGPFNHLKTILKNYLTGSLNFVLRLLGFKTTPHGDINRNNTISFHAAIFP